jgi:hypothetical protein
MTLDEAVAYVTYLVQAWLASKKAVVLAKELSSSDLESRMASTTASRRPYALSSRRVVALHGLQRHRDLRQRAGGSRPPDQPEPAWGPRSSQVVLAIK